MACGRIRRASILRQQLIGCAITPALPVGGSFLPNGRSIAAVQQRVIQEVRVRSGRCPGDRCIKVTLCKRGDVVIVGDDVDTGVDTNGFEVACHNLGIIDPIGPAGHHADIERQTIAVFISENAIAALLPASRLKQRDRFGAVLFIG